MLKKILLVLCLLLNFYSNSMESTEEESVEKSVNSDFIDQSNLPEKPSGNLLSVKNLASLKIIALKKLAFSDIDIKQLCSVLPDEFIEPFLEYKDLYKLSRIIEEETNKKFYKSSLPLILAKCIEDKYNSGSRKFTPKDMAHLFLVSCNHNLSFAASIILHHFCNHCIEEEANESFKFVIQLIDLINLKKISKLNLEPFRLSFFVSRASDLYNELESSMMDIKSFNVEKCHNFNVQPFVLGSLLQADIETLSLLLAKGFSANDQDLWGNNALVYLFRNETKASIILRWLFENGVTTNSFGKVHPLFTALVHRNFYSAKNLLENMPAGEQPTICSQVLADLLDSCRDHSDSIKFLLNYEVTISNKVIQSSIKRFLEHTDQFFVILQAKIDPKFLDYLDLCNFVLDKGKQELECLKLIINMNPALIAKFDSKQCNFLMAACKAHSLKDKRDARNLIEFILDQGCDVDFADKDGTTPLMYACIKGKKSLVEIFLNHNANTGKAKYPTFKQWFPTVLEISKTNRGKSKTFEEIYQLISKATKPTLLDKLKSK